MNNAIEYTRLFDHQGHLNEEGAAFYAEEILAGREENLPSGLRDHVSLCRHCAAQCLEMVMVLKEIDDSEAAAGEDLPAAEPFFSESPAEAVRSQSVRMPVIWRRYRIVAGFLLLGSIGLFLLLWLSEMKREEGLVSELHKGEMLKQQQAVENWVASWAGKNEGFGERFTLNPAFEKLLAMAFRSGAFAVISPDSSAVFNAGDTVFFRWTGSGTATLYLRVSRNTGETIHQRKLTHHQAYYLPAKPLPGLYYWFIELDGIKAAGGRFIVSRPDEGRPQ